MGGHGQTLSDPNMPHGGKNLLVSIQSLLPYPACTAGLQSSLAQKKIDKSDQQLGVAW